MTFSRGRTRDEFGNCDWGEGFSDPTDEPRFTVFERLIMAGLTPEAARAEIERRADRGDAESHSFDCSGAPNTPDEPDRDPAITYSLTGETP